MTTVFLSTLPAYSQAVCRDSTSITPDCPDLFYSAMCSSYASPFSTSKAAPCCENGQPGCEFIQTLPFELVCDTTIVPTCQCNTSFLSKVCTLSKGLLPDTSNCTCKCFSGTGCPNYNKCCPFGCCPSNPNQCKCPFNDQCYPFPDLSSSEIAFFCTASTTIYSCNPGYTQCPSDPTVPGKCCLYGCCPSDPTKCKCPNNNQCSPNCTTSDLTACNSTYPSCNGTCPAGQECSPSVTGTTIGCSCFSTANTNPPTSAPDINFSCQLPCSNSSVCGSGKYCNLDAMCCEVNPSGCLKGCNLNTNECGNNEQCVSNCCAPLKPEVVITELESKTVASGSKIYYLTNLTVTGLKFQSKSKCSIFAANHRLRMKFNPPTFTLEAGKSSATINGLVKKYRALRKINSIIVDVSCDNGTSASKTIPIER